MSKRKKSYFIEFIKGWGKKRITVAICVILIIISSIMFFYGMLYRASKNSIIDKGKITAVQSAEEFDRYLTTGVSSMKLTGNHLEKMLANNSTIEELREYLADETDTTKVAILEMASSIYAYINGVFIDGSGWVPPADFVPKERPWYINAIEKKGDLAVTDPYVDANTGSTIVTLSKLLSDGKSIVGIDILMDEIQNMTEEIAQDNDGSIECVLDSKGNVLSHSEKDQLGKCYTEEKGTFYSEIAKSIYTGENAAAQKGYFEVNWNGGNYIVYTVPIQGKWVSVSIMDSSKEFISLNIMLIVTITLLIGAIVLMLLLFSRAARRDMITAKLNSQLSSSANIYMSVYDIDMINHTYSDIKNDIERVTNVLDSMDIDEGQVQKQINFAMTHFTSDEYKDIILEFIDLETLDERMENTNTLTIEYLSNTNTWRRGRWIASERTEDGRLGHVLWVIEDIDIEKSARDLVYNKAQQLGTQIHSVANIYLSMYDINIINDTYTEMKVSVDIVSDVMSECKEQAQESFYSASSQLSAEESRDEIHKFVTFSTLDERMGDLDTITIEFLGITNKWCRGRFIVSERTEEGKISHVLWLIEDIDSEKRKRDKIFDTAQQLMVQLRSVANIYTSVHDIDIINNSFTEINISDDVVANAISNDVHNAQELFRQVMTTLTDKSSLSEVLEFIDFSNIEKNVEATGSAAIEFLNSRGMWCRGRIIVSRRTEEGRVSHVIWAVENIDTEKRNRDKMYETARQLTTQLKSAVNIYTSAHDIDVINDTFTVLHTADKIIAEAVGDNTQNAQKTLYSIQAQMTEESCKDDVMQFINLSTLDERMSDKDTLTLEYKNTRHRWRRGRFIVSERTEDGKLSHVLWTVEDIDDEKKIRDQLFDIANSLNTQLSSMGDIYVSVCDIDIIEDKYNEIKTKNKDIKNISLGYEDSAQLYIFKEIDRMTDRTSTGSVHDFVNLNSLNKRMKQSNTITIEFLNSNKQWCRGRFIASQWTPGGKLSHVLWTVENINEEKLERDKLLDISEKAIAASAAKSAFLSNMSHEIRTPINAVLGMNEMVLRECDDQNILAYSESIKTAGNTLLGLINDILDFSKIESGKMEIIPVDYDLASVLNDLVNMVQTRADNKGLTLKLDFNQNIPQYLNGDEIRIKQVITNILTNAVKYTKEGIVTFGISYEKLELEPDYIMINVYVKDTGIGIKEEDMAKLFSEFERIDEAQNRNIEGTGLGMNITKRLLNMMDSNLKVQSIYELGSKFSFSLKQRVVKWNPIGDYEASYRSSLSSKKKYKEKFTAPQAHVLVIDDTPMNLMVFKSLLKQTKIQIDMANSGDEGISMALENKYDMIFLDHMMPKKDGIQTLKEMKAEPNNPNLSTPIVSLTANAISGAREQYIEAGFDDYLTKPIDPVKLEEMLMHYLPEHKLIFASADGISSTADTGDNIISPIVYDIKEIDVKKGISNCGDEESYAMTLATYANTLDGYINEIQGLYDEKDIQNATIKIHALKSTSRIIGATDIGEKAQELENAGNAGNKETLDNELGPFLDRCRKLAEQLIPLRSNDDIEDNSDLPLISDTEFEEACSIIKDYSSNFNSKGITEVLDDMKAFRFTDEQKELITKIKKAVNDYDYDAINTLLN